MSLIYEPKGKAREYSPLALNIYSGCDHHCKYCYVKNIIGERQNTPLARKNLITELIKETSAGIDKQVLLCFMGDPYCRLEMELQLTRQALDIMQKNKVPVAILTKGGTRAFRDSDIIAQFDAIKMGATLTFDNNDDSIAWEPGAALPDDRIEMLKGMHHEGIKTWVSIEPVIDPTQSLSLIRKTLPFVDQYKVGRWNHNKEANAIDWKTFGKEAITILRSAGKQFYVKEDLAVFLDNLAPHETNSDLLALTPKHSNNIQETLTF